MVTTDTAKGVYCWDLSRLQDEPILIMPLQKGNEWASADFGDGGRGVVTAGKNGIQFWCLDLESIIGLAAMTASRNLSLEEWYQYFPGQVYRSTIPGLPVPDGVLTMGPGREGPRPAP